MARLPHKANFRPKNPQKYMGKNLHDITYRSSWEHSMMMVCDSHPDIVAWGSECLAIPYFNPLTRKNTLYVPDFVITYVDKQGRQVTEMIEVKPKDQMPGSMITEGTARTTRIKQGIQIVNQAKWAEAVKFCKRRGWKFTVACEDQMFGLRKYNKGART